MTERDDALDWDTEERDRYMDEHDGEDGPEVDVVVESDA